MNKRKFFGTILGILFWSVCILFFTYAYYEWKSDDASIVFGIKDLTVRCIPGADVSATNIGPVLNYADGVSTKFSIENDMDKVMAVDLRLDITSISDNLLVDSFKYALVTDATGGTNYDYNDPVLEGTFKNFKVGSNIITKSLHIGRSATHSFEFIIYIDGNEKNDINMQNNALEANLKIGNCEEDATTMDEIVYQAIYSSTDDSLTFIHDKSLEVGDVYNGKTVTTVYTGFETDTYSSYSEVPWYNNRANITTVVVEDYLAPDSTSYWFYDFYNLVSADLYNLDTSGVSMSDYMFYGCDELTTEITIDTTKIISYNGMFSNAATANGALIIVNYFTASYLNVGYMISTKSPNSNVVRGSCVDC